VLDSFPETVLRWVLTGSVMAVVPGMNMSVVNWPELFTGVQYIAGLYTQTDPVLTEDFVLWNLRASFRISPVGWISGQGEKTFWLRNTKSMPVIPCHGQPSWQDSMSIFRNQSLEY
jgi:esterase/lipase superfamily enzyme